MPSAALSIAHDIPGRLRVRLPAVARTDGISDALARLDGVHSARWSPTTRSLLIHYRPDVVTTDDLLDAIELHAGVEFGETTAESANGDASTVRISSVVAGSVRQLNERVTRATAGRVSLALAVPIGLTVWALFDLMRGPIRPLAWTSALWYAHGLFRDYSLPTSRD